MRLTLIRMEDQRYELLWSQHHLLMDGWSAYLVLKEVMAAYQALTQGRQCSMEPARPFRDHINWLQRQDSSKAEAVLAHNTQRIYRADVVVGQSSGCRTM